MAFKFHLVLVVLVAVIAIAKGISTAECPTAYAPKLCTDDATIRGTATHLTYLCPESTPTAYKTVLVTVTQTVAQTVTLTPAVIETVKPGTPAPRDGETTDKTTTITESRTSTILLTKTVQTAKPTSSVASTPPAGNKPTVSPTNNSTTSLIRTITLSNTANPPLPSSTVTANSNHTTNGTVSSPVPYSNLTVNLTPDKRSPARTARLAYSGAVTQAMDKKGSAQHMAASMSFVALAMAAVLVVV